MGTQLTDSVGHATGAVPSNLPEPRCDCDHTLSEHRDGRGRCKAMVLTHASVFRKPCGCDEFHQSDQLAEAHAIIKHTSMMLPAMKHLEALHDAWTKATADLVALRNQVAEEAFNKKVAENLYGKFTVICNGCDYEEDFGGFSTEEAATWLRDNGWELVQSAGEWKLVCMKCFRSGAY